VVRENVLNADWTLAFAERPVDERSLELPAAPGYRGSQRRVLGRLIDRSALADHVARITMGDGHRLPQTLTFLLAIADAQGESRKPGTGPCVAGGPRASGQAPPFPSQEQAARSGSRAQVGRRFLPVVWSGAVKSVRTTAVVAGFLAASSEHTVASATPRLEKTTDS